MSYLLLDMNFNLVLTELHCVKKQKVPRSITLRCHKKGITSELWWQHLGLKGTETKARWCVSVKATEIYLVRASSWGRGVLAACEI